MFIVLLCSWTQFLMSQNWQYNNNRIAISADGNNGADYKDKWPKADPDDWGATPVTIAMIVKMNLTNKLVHYSYNNFIESNVSPDDENMMAIGVNGAIARFNLNPNIFFDVSKNNEKAKTNLVNELKKSTQSDPLFFLHMGPSEFFYQCIKQCIDEGGIEALKNVYVISHSGYNDNHLRRPYHHTMEQAIELSGNRINYKRIKDQNAAQQPNVLWNSSKNFMVWYWMRDSKDPNIRWLFDCMNHHPNKVADISDAGLAYYLLTGDDNGSPSKLKDMFGNEILPNSEVHPDKLILDCKELSVFTGETNKISATVLPEIISNKNIIWESDNPQIATVNEGFVKGLRKGKTVITACTQDGNIHASVGVEVMELPKSVSSFRLSAISDFNYVEDKDLVPFYKDYNNKAIAIDAGKYKHLYTAAIAVFEGKTGLYDITLNTLKETDGECKYVVKVNDRIIGEVRNNATLNNYEPSSFTFHKVTLRKGDRITVKSNSNSNYKIPEGKDYAYARGRWTSVDFIQADPEVPDEIIPTLILLNAQDIATKGSWKIVKDAIVPNGAYITYDGENHYDKETATERLEIPVKITEPGVYGVLWSMRQPAGQRGSDKGNDAWLCIDGGKQLVNGKEITGYHKFVSRSSDNFSLGGQLDLPDGQPMLYVQFDKPGTYKLRVSGRSKGLQIARFVIFKGYNIEDLRAKLFYM